MLKRSLTVLLIAVAVASAFPAIGGSRGFYRITDTKTDGYGMLSLSLHNTLQRGTVGDTQWYQLALNGGVTYAPLDWMEFWVSPTYAFWTEDFGFGSTRSGFYNTDFGLKASVLAVPVFKFGAMGLGSINTLNDGFGFFDTTVHPGFGYGGGVLLGFDFRDISISAPFNVVLNVGYLGNTGTNVGDSLALGLGLELPAKTYAVTLEATTTQGLTSFMTLDSNVIRITPGIKFTFPFGVGLDLGLDIAIGNAPTFQGILGINFVSPFLRPAPPAVGVIAGSVRDAITQSPMVATVSFADTAIHIAAVTTDAATGVFEFKDVPVGKAGQAVLTIKAKASGYREASMPLVVKENETTTQDILLMPLQTYGSITGVVKDAKTGRLVAAAKVILKGINRPAVKTDVNGYFYIDSIPTGVASVEVTADSFVPAISTVQIEVNKTATLDFTLKTSIVIGQFIGQVMDRKTEEPLAAEVRFPDTNIPTIKTDPATGVFKAQIPVGTYAIVVSAEGYIDQPSPLVIVETPATEKEFKLVKKGMTFTLRGIYFDYDKATIKPESYPVLDEAAKILKENPSIRVEIQGHTDSDGSDEYNQKLSEARAASVVNYFVMNHQIDPKRLVARGYGESMPIASNATEAGKALNRRVEFVILGEI